VSTETLVFLHLLGAFLFVGGSMVAAVPRVLAIRRGDAREVAAVLRVARAAVPFVGVGFLVAVGFGFALVERLHVDRGATWLVATFALLGWMLVAGAIAGRRDRRAREHAERLVRENAVGDDNLRRLVVDPVGLWLNGSMVLATLAIVALMAFKPA
jgi:uncharacterized membrane protein